VARKRNGKRADDPRLDGRENKQQNRRRRRPALDDDSLWLMLGWAHLTYSRRLDGVDFSPTANLKLAHVLATEDVICMRESRINPQEREYVSGSIFRSPATLISALSSSSAVSLPKATGPIQGWTYYVSKADFNKLLGPQEEIPPGQISTGRRAKGDWKWVVAREVIQRLMTGKKFPTAKEMLDFCSSKIRYAPDASDMRKHLKELKEKKN
jgi:hypothetical protein